MSKKIYGVALSDKNVLKGAVRSAITENVVSELFGVLSRMGYEKGDKNNWSLEYVDNNGNKVYAILDLTVSTTHPNDRATKKTTKKSKVAETFTIEE